MSVVAESAPRARECLSDTDVNIDVAMASLSTPAKSRAGSTASQSEQSDARKRKEAPSSSPSHKICSEDDRQSASLAATPSQHATPAVKKLKAQQTPLPSDAKQSPTQSASSPSLVQLKNGKLILKQKPVDWSRSMSALQAIIAFNQWLEEQGDAVVTAIPDEHLGIFSILSAESDKSLNDLAKHIKTVVIPAADVESADSDDDEVKVDRLPLPVIASAVESVAERVNYGIDAVPSSSTSDVSIPAALQLWRWEARDVTALPAESRDKIVARRDERVRARREAAELLASLSDGERGALLSKGRKVKQAVSKADETAHASRLSGGKLEAQDADVSTQAPTRVFDDDVFTTPPRPTTSVERFPAVKEEEKRAASASPTKRPSVSPTKSSASHGSPGSSSKTLSPEQQLKSLEKEAKRKAREAKRAEVAKREAEKEAKKTKAELAQKRAASFMSNFVNRPRSSSPTKDGKGGAISDFDRVFPPCNYKDMAPINRFSARDSLAGPSAWGADAQSSDACLVEAKGPRPRKTPRSAPGIHPAKSVRECMRMIAEAGIMGDESDAHRALAFLSNRKRIPVKLLHFHTDRRPAWFGTWTRSTNYVRARRPLGQDPVALDYTYDSEAEWVEDDPSDAEDVQDNDKDDDNESHARSDSDSEMDDWLVDDLEVEEEEDDHPALRDPNIVGFGPPLPGTSAVNELEPKKKVKKYKPIGRRFESKLVKFETGPHWEAELGVATYEGFKDFQMEMINDAYIGVDPFTFCSEETTHHGQDISSAHKGIESDDAKHNAPSSDGAGSANGLTSAVKDSVTAQQATIDRANAFPQDRLSDLLRAVHGSTMIRSVLLEDLKQKFGSLGKHASKTNMEACLHIYAEPKGKKAGSTWTVKAEHRALAGIGDQPGQLSN